MVSAWTLRQSVRLDLALLAIAGIVAVGLLAVFVIVGDPTTLWRDALDEMMARMNELAGSTPGFATSTPDGANVVDVMARLMTGGGAATVFWVASAALLLGRSWQAKLYNPGGFQPEFHGLAFGRTATLTGAGIVALALSLPAFPGREVVLTGTYVIVIFSIIVQGLTVGRVVRKVTA